MIVGIVTSKPDKTTYTEEEVLKLIKFMAINRGNRSIVLQEEKKVLKIFKDRHL